MELFLGVWLPIFIVSLLLILALIPVLRRFILWYYRINHIVERLEQIEHYSAKLDQIEKHLAKIAAKYPDRLDEKDNHTES